LPAAEAQEKSAPTLKVGIIGLDTSHVTAFTSVLNNPKAEGELAGVRVVAAYPGGSPDIRASASRVEGFTKTLREKYQVEIVDSIDDLLKKVDVVLLESVDGRPHLKQVIPVLKAGKLCFIDKPVAGTLADALKIYALSKKYRTPVFSTSSLRYYPDIVKMRNDPKVGKILSCETSGPCELEPHHPDLFWYGIHGVEALFTIMGPGCQTVTRKHTQDTDVVTGIWKDGRKGTFRGSRPGRGYEVTVSGDKGNVAGSVKGSYQPMLVEICKFFRTGKPPVSAEETIEIFAFMEAADESKRQGGTPVTLESVLAKARRQNQTSGLKLVPVSGTVTLEGAPLKAGKVGLVPDTAKGNRLRMVCAGQIGTNGRFEIETEGSKGAPPGWYRLIVTNAQPPVNRNYLDEKRTPIAIEVIAGSAPGAYDIRLTK
jgi:hypothetical protein